MRTRKRWVGAAAASVLAIALTPLAPSAMADEDDPITDPVVEDPVPSTLGLVLEEYAQLPQTRPHPPGPTDPRSVRHARINYIGELPDGSGRMYVPDLNGPLYLLEDGEPTVYLDLKERFPDFYSATGLGSGAGFAAFHPDFAENGVFYTVHTERFGAFDKEPSFPEQTPQTSNATHGIITEWTADDPTADTFSGTSREVMRIAFGHRIHGLQQIDFNPNAEPGDEDYGLLYVAAGDGGLGVDRSYPQDLSNPYGKILRIDPDGSNRGTYGVPASNPFVGQDGAIGEIFAYGMRDPHRFSWDVGGEERMYLGHIGQHAVEGVYDVRAGDNLGWSEIEGRLDFRSHNQCYLYPLSAEQEEADYVFPVTSFDHETPSNWSCNSDSGHAISGGFVHRGSLPGLRGKYVFGDLVTGNVYFSEVDDFDRDAPTEAAVGELALYDADGTRMRMPDFVDDGRIDLRFGTDEDQNLYLLSKANGKVWKVADTKQAPVPREVEPGLADNLVASYGFEYPFGRDDSYEFDRGLSKTLLKMVNGGEDMRVDDGAYPGSNNAMQIHSAAESPTGEPWKAGVWDDDGAASLRAFNGAEGITLMGWVKMTGQNPTPGYNAIGLTGVLSGNSEGHNVRALLELIQVDGEMRLVALGRRIDTGSSQIFAATKEWRELLPQDEWVHLAATFDYTTGEMALYRNGQPVDGYYTKAGDPWQVDGTGTTGSDPKGIKIGGSFPQDGSERNPCNCRMDGLMFFDDDLSSSDVARQYRRMTEAVR